MSITLRPRRSPRRRNLAGRTTLHSIALMLIIGLVVATGTGVSYALWVSAATATTNSSGAQLVVTTNFADANTVFANDNLAATGSFTLTNTTVTTSTTAGTYGVALASTGAAALRSALTVSVWPTTTPATCPTITTVPGGAVTGTWASFTAAITGTVAAGASKSYCLRMGVTDRSAIASTSGALLITPTVTATLSVGTWGATSSASTTQKTAFVFPTATAAPSTWFQLQNVGTGSCLDVYSAQTATNTALIDYACKTGNTTGEYNQQWGFTPSSGGYYTITPRGAPALRVDIEGASTANLAPVNVQTSSAARQSQEWLMQLTPSGAFQFVNRLSGRCLEPNNTAVFAVEVEMAQVACDGSAEQRYTMITKEAIVPNVTLACASAAGGGITYSWTGAAIDTYNFFGKLGAGAFAAIGNAAAGATSITILPAAITTGDGTYTAEARWGTNVLDDAPFYKKTTGGVSTLSCVQPLGAITCASSGTRNVLLSWNFAANAAYQVQATAGTTWTNIVTATTGSTGVIVVNTTTTSLPSGALTFRVISGTDVSGSVAVTKGGTTNNPNLDCG